MKTRLEIFNFYHTQSRSQLIEKVAARGVSTRNSIYL